MKKNIMTLCSITIFMLANYGDAQTQGGSCVQSLSPSSPGGPEGVANQNPTACTEFLGFCGGFCTGYQPAAGLVCDTCAAWTGDGLNGKTCTPGNDSYSATKVYASCTGWAACGCGSNWTAYTPTQTTQIMCGATGDAC